MWTNLTISKMLNDIANVPRQHAEVGEVPFHVRYEAAMAAMDILIAWNREGERNE